jgi:general secretion pathway protein G
MRHDGFTIIELVITVAIVGLLATMALPLAQLEAQRAKESGLRQAERQIRGAIDAYKDAAVQGRIKIADEATGYPPNLEALVDGVEDLASVTQQKIYFLRRLPRDPFNSDSTLDAAATWGLRSYASAPDDPQPGDDVYDVYSLAPGKGLNGVPYHDW